MSDLEKFKKIVRSMRSAQIKYFTSKNEVHRKNYLILAKKYEKLVDEALSLKLF